MQNRYLLLSISVVGIHDPTATPTVHDPDYTLQSNINIAGLFYVRYTQLLIGVISNITSVMNIHGPATIPTFHDHNNNIVSITKLSRTYPYTHGYYYAISAIVCYINRGLESKEVYTTHYGKFILAQQHGNQGFPSTISLAPFWHRINSIKSFSFIPDTN